MYMHTYVYAYTQYTHVYMNILMYNCMYICTYSCMQLYKSKYIFPTYLFGPRSWISFFTASTLLFLSFLNICYSLNTMVLCCIFAKEGSHWVNILEKARFTSQSTFMLLSQVYWQYYSIAERFKWLHMVFWNPFQLWAESNLKVGQIAKVQEIQHFFSVRIYLNDFLIQCWDSGT